MKKNDWDAEHNESEFPLYASTHEDAKEIIKDIIGGIAFFIMLAAIIIFGLAMEG